MKKAFARVICVAMILSIALLFNGSVEATNAITSKQFSEMSNEELKSLQTSNPFQKVFSQFLLSIGDYAHDFLSQTLKEEVSIDKIVYNKTAMLNANFFTDTSNAAFTSTSNIVKNAINTWYSVFQKIALIVIIFSIVIAGIKIMTGTGSDKAGAYESLKKIVLAVVLVFLFPYAMKIAFDINEAIVQTIYNQTHTYDTAIGTVISQVSDLTMDELEFRSPQYVSANGLRVGPGSSEATLLYLNKLSQYQASADYMRIMRAYAGVTLRVVYVFMWYIMLAQVYYLIIIYLKRYMLIAFLIAIYPLTIIGYITGGMFGKSQTSFNSWCKKFFSNVFLQSIHAIIYGVISGVVIEQLKGNLYGENVNFFLIIVANSFLFTGEKILGKLWNAAIDTSERKGARGIFGAPKRIINSIRGS